MPGKTLYDKLWEDHVVYTEDDGSSLIYIDRQLVHEVTSPQAFEGLRLTGRKPWRADRNLAVADHNVPTTDRDKGINCRYLFFAPATLLSDPRRYVSNLSIALDNCDGSILANLASTSFVPGGKMVIAPFLLGLGHANLLIKLSEPDLSVSTHKKKGKSSSSASISRKTSILLKTDW